MKIPAKVVMKIVSVSGTCEVGHQAGQEFDLSGEITLGYSKKPNTICPALFYAIYPNLRVLRFGGSFPLGKRPGYGSGRLPRSPQPCGCPSEKGEGIIRFFSPLFKENSSLAGFL